MTPRYEPSWGPLDDDDEFVGHIGELDVWLNKNQDRHSFLYTVGPSHRHEPQRENYDCFKIDGNMLVIDGCNDLNVTPYELGRLYEMAMEKGLIQ